MFAALIGAAAWAEPALPLESESFAIDVTGNVAEIVFKQRFRNRTEEFLDATYLFPLDNDAVVDSMVMVIGDRTVRSVVYAKEEARQRFDDAAAAGRIAALTEQQRPNVFAQDVANLPPGEAIDVELHVVQPVDRVDGEWTLTVPLVVGPRFFRADDPDEALQQVKYVAPPESLDLFADTEVRTDGTGVRASIDAVVHAGLPIREFGSPSHPVTPEVVEDDASVVLDEVPLTRDFVLTWRTAGDEPAAGLLVGERHAMLLLEAPRTSTFAERAPREIVWVIDTSCSMSGAPLDIAQHAMDQALLTMDPRDSFTVLGFSSAVSGLSDRPVPATVDNVARGRAFVRNLAAAGGTNMDLALRAALALPIDPQRRRTVVFATDGFIGYDTEFLRQIGEDSPQATFVTLGIGAAPNRYLLDEMARLGGGVAAYADLNEGSGEEAMAGLVDAMDRPVLTNVAIDWGPGCPAHALAPVSIPDLRPGRPILLLAKVEQGCAGAVTVTARGGDGEHVFELTPEHVPQERALASTWARERVADLERQWMRGEAKEVADAVREIGLSYSIVTSETSLLAVDERVVNPGGEANHVLQPLDLPDGTEVAATGNAGVGAVLNQGFLQAIPAGRTYQSAVQTVPGVSYGGNPNIAGAASNENTYLLDGVNVTDPVTGTFSLNMSHDLLEPGAAWSGMPEVGGGPTPAVPKSGTNNLAAHAEVAGLVNPDNGGNGHAGVSTAGPLARDHLWFTGAAMVDRRALGDLRADRASWSAGLTMQPGPVHRMSLFGSGDPAQFVGPTGTSRWGGTGGRAQWAWFPSAAVSVESAVSGATRAFGAARRDDVGVSVEAAAIAIRDPLGDSHDLKVGVATSSWRVLGPTELQVLGGSAFAQDAVTMGTVQLAGGARIDGAGGEARVSPRLHAGWDPLGGDRFELSSEYARFVDATRYLPAELADVALPVRDRLSLGARVRPITDVTIELEGAWSRSRFAFAPSPSLVPLPSAAVPAVEQRVATVSAGIRKAFSRRWKASLGFVAQPLREPTDAALLRDPTAPFVPGFLDAYRAYGWSADVSWDLPTDPSTTTIGGFARWQSAVDAGAPEWWLQDVLALGAKLNQRVDVRRGALDLTASLGWYERDLSALWLPIEALTLPGTPSVADQPPLRLDAQIGYTF